MRLENKIINNMLTETHIKSLSALEPLEFVYEYSTQENFSKVAYQYDNQLRYNRYNLFENIQDVVISNKNILFLTDITSIDRVFQNPFTETKVGNIPGAFYLKPKNTNQYVKTLNNNFFVGGQGLKILFTLIPLSNGKCELRTSNQSRLQVSREYPYTIINSTEILAENELNLVQFEVDYVDNQMSFKVETAEGFRYLSYGVDLQIRAVGLMLNETVINSYIFEPEFVSQQSLNLGYIPTTSEIKYFNEFNQQETRTSVAIKECKQANTHLLVSCATNLSDKTNVNIAHLKTNFNASGTYSPTK